MLDKMMKGLVDLVYRTGQVRRKFEVSNPNEKVLAADASKGIVTKESQDIRHSHKWVTSQRAVILLTDRKIICGKWTISLDAIFSCGGRICLSVFEAAEKSGNKVIGVDDDQSSESPTIITSAMKQLAQPVYDLLGSFYAGAFPGGQSLLYSAANNGVGIPMETSAFKSFSGNEYGAIYKKLADGEVVVDNSIATEPEALQTSVVTVEACHTWQGRGGR